MLCSKIGGACSHPVDQDNKFVFVLMPFNPQESFDNIYFTIQAAVKGIKGKNFKCERADEKYTNFQIWCKNICKNIRKAKYLIVDTTGRNPNVFYELGFSHALENTKAILITQSVKDAPFDIADLNHIEYSQDNIRKLTEDLQKAIADLEEEDEGEGYERKSSEELIRELKSKVRQEEERASNFKKELLETEERERKLKQYIKESEAIRDNPVQEAKNRISELEGVIYELKSKLNLTEKSKTDELSRLQDALKAKEKKLKNLEKEYSNSKKSNDNKSLSTFLLDDTQKKAEAVKWFIKANDEHRRGNNEKSIEYYTQSIELNPDDATAFYNRGLTYKNLKNYDNAIEDYTKAIEINPDFAKAYNNRGVAFEKLKDYDNAIKNYTKAIELNPDYAPAFYNRGNAYNKLKNYDNSIKDYNKAIELNPKDFLPYENLAELLIIVGDYQKALQTIKRTTGLSLEIEHQAESLYLECIAKKMLDMDESDCERELTAILKKDFTTTWGFDPIEFWLAEGDIPADKKAFIDKITAELKKHQS
jgi:tetratricopeptide (TPR) repeat protein